MGGGGGGGGGGGSNRSVVDDPPESTRALESLLRKVSTPDIFQIAKDAARLKAQGAKPSSEQGLMAAHHRLAAAEHGMPLSLGLTEDDVSDEEVELTTVGKCVSMDP